jgi:hypothetical protein
MSLEQQLSAAINARNAHKDRMNFFNGQIALLQQQIEERDAQEKA